MSKPRKRLIVTGDRVLISPEEDRIRTEIGLYLPKSIAEKEPVQTGRIVATGPGIPLPEPHDVDDEPWKSHAVRHARHLPMQAEAGDVAIFLRRAAVEIQYDNKTYLVVPQAAILVLLRDDLERPGGPAGDVIARLPDAGDGTV
ncbi:MAG TPA: co-chaperone GroES [bacterium]|nr:co-chaperone GroES [bacterium]